MFQRGNDIEERSSQYSGTFRRRHKLCLAQRSRLLKDEVPVGHDRECATVTDEASIVSMCAGKCTHCFAGAAIVQYQISLRVLEQVSRSGRRETRHFVLGLRWIHEAQPVAAERLLVLRKRLLLSKSRFGRSVATGSHQRTQWKSLLQNVWSWKSSIKYLLRHHRANEMLRQSVAH